jgi:hypothetical protein
MFEGTLGVTELSNIKSIRVAFAMEPLRVPPRGARKGFDILGLARTCVFLGLQYRGSSITPVLHLSVIVIIFC